MSGQFDSEMFAGAGAAGTAEKSGVIVTVFSQMKLDRSDSDESMLLHESRGLLGLKKVILKALSAHSLVDHSGHQILLNLMEPMNSGHPRDDGDAVGEFSVVFATDFVWDLS